MLPVRVEFLEKLRLFFCWLPSPNQDGYLEKDEFAGSHAHLVVSHFYQREFFFWRVGPAEVTVCKAHPQKRIFEGKNGIVLSYLI